MNSLKLGFRISSVISYIDCFICALIIVVNIFTTTEAFDNIRLIAILIYVLFCYFSFRTGVLLWNQKELNVPIFFRTLLALVISIWLISIAFSVIFQDYETQEVIFEDLSNETINNIPVRTGIFVNDTLHRKCADVCNRVEGAIQYTVFYGNDFAYYVCSCYSQSDELLTMVPVD